MPFLPISAADMKERGWEQTDFARHLPAHLPDTRQLSR